MKFKANPVIVDAYEILEVHPGDENGFIPLTLAADSPETSHEVEASPQMTARYLPQAGDYWVVQDDGYTYLNPKDVFERKYSRITDDAGDAAI